MPYLRSFLFVAGFLITLIPYTTFGLLVYPLPFRKRFRFFSSWVTLVLWWLKVACKIDYQVEGSQHLPDRPSIVMSNHQSTWETFALQKVFPPVIFVLKRELLLVPFFGWGMALLEPIAINRATGRKAVHQLLEQGRERLRSGRWILVFPEGTRVPPGKVKPFKQGGAILAADTEAPVVPVAHNAGYLWPRRQLLKRPGLITVSIGPPISTAGKSAQEINREAYEWIRNRTAELGAPKPPGDKTTRRG